MDPDLAPPTSLLAPLATQYLEALVEGRRRDAVAMIHRAIDSGERTIRAIYLDVFEPVLHEVGRRWQHNLITIAQEHFISAATQLIMAQLYSQIFATKRRGRTMVAACAGVEFHEIGLRMVADFFELDGWDTYYLGANLPGAAILGAVVERDADLLAISATMTQHRDATREVIADIRGTPSLANTIILIGGGAFRTPPSLWQEFGADGYAANAASAVNLANDLCDARPYFKR